MQIKYSGNKAIMRLVSLFFSSVNLNEPARFLVYGIYTIYIFFGLVNSNNYVKFGVLNCQIKRQVEMLKT